LICLHLPQIKFLKAFEDIEESLTGWQGSIKAMKVRPITDLVAVIKLIKNSAASQSTLVRFELDSPIVITGLSITDKVFSFAKGALSVVTAVSAFLASAPVRSSDQLLRCALFAPQLRKVGKVKGIMMRNTGKDGKPTPKLTVVTANLDCRSVALLSMLLRARSCFLC
jgi:hypothetical protein